MTRSKKIDAYIIKHSHWQENLIQIRAVFNSTELTEDIKWGAPAYLLDKKIIAGVAGFKNHMGIWFHQGVFLKDTHKMLVNAQEGKTKALRQWKIVKGDIIDSEILKEYILEAIQNCKDGKEMKPQSKAFKISEVLQKALKEDVLFQNAFKKLSPGKQKEYTEYIADAKQEKTKQRRLEKIKPMIIQGVGLHDKYKNC